MSDINTENQIDSTTEIQKENSVIHPPIYPNSDDPKVTEKIVGEFNKYYTRLKRMYMVSKNEQERIINNLKITEITRLKVILKYFLHRDKIDHEAIKFVTQMIQEIHNQDYENKIKSKIKKQKSVKQQNHYTKPVSENKSTNSEYKYSRVSPSYSKSNTEKETKQEIHTPKKQSSRYQKMMNFQNKHNNKRK